MFFALAALLTLVAKGADTRPIITSELSATSSVGAAFNYTITASNSPVSYKAVPLPPGLALDKASGVISGTLTAGGTFNVYLIATNAAGESGKAILSLSVTGSSEAATYTNVGPLKVVAGAPFKEGFSATGALPISIGATALPPGVTLTNDGIISGTPSSTGHWEPGYGFFNSTGGIFIVLSLDVADAITALPGNGTITVSLSDSYKDGTGHALLSTPFLTPSSSLTVSATLSLEAITDFSAINEETIFALVAGDYHFKQPLGNAPSLGGALDLAKGTASFMDTTNIDTGDSEPHYVPVNFGSVVLRWDTAKKLLTVKASRKITTKLTAAINYPASNILCKQGDNSSYSPSSSTVFCQIEFGPAHAWTGAPMAGKAKTTKSGDDLKTSASAKCKKAVGNGTGTPPPIGTNN